MVTELLTLCDFAAYDLSGMTIVGAKDAFNCEHLPYTIDLPYVAARVSFESREDGEKEVTFTILSPDGRDVMDAFRFPVMFASNGRLKTSMPFAQRLPPITVNEFGEHAVVLQIGAEYRSQASLNIMHGGLRAV